MIISPDELRNYLGIDLESRLERFSPELRETVRKLDEISRQTTNTPFLDYLTVQHQQEVRSIRSLAEECGIGNMVLLKIFKEYSIPKRTQAEGVRANWQDPEFRARQAEGTREARLNSKNAGKFYLPTIQGTRKDIGYAKSTWEANLARVFSYIGREYLMHEKMKLTIANEQKYLFKDIKSDMGVDFIVTDPRGNLKIYEIMAHPFKDPKGVAKLEMLAEQYPTIKIKPVSARLYRRLEQRFQERINGDARFAGWEQKEDNVRDNPAKYK